MASGPCSSQRHSSASHAPYGPGGNASYRRGPTGSLGKRRSVRPPIAHRFPDIERLRYGAHAAADSGPIWGPGESFDSNVTKAAALAVDRYPKLREIAAAVALTNSSQEFQAGLEIILRGIALEQRRSA